MQTFLPYKDFKKTASILDRQRLGKQRVETMQIMKSFLNSNHGWRHHPAIKMWKGYPWALLQYQRAICNEWITKRGYRDTCLEKTEKLYYLIEDKNEGKYPPWLGNDDFHISHQSNLVRKKPEHYLQFFVASPDMEYIWP